MALELDEKGQVQSQMTNLYLLHPYELNKQEILARPIAGSALLGHPKSTAHRLATAF